ncbi:MAG: hypothetical protein E7525_05525 [Ruminococcaceae bacterium]|nr:hypothetical protein [Oscillospiraceae bacterium]
MLDSFVGNDNLKETVRTAVKSGRFPHAFIIEGEPGSGRHTFAKMLAAAAVCESENSPCGHCRTCNLVENDGHCDVLTYAPDGATFKIDTVRSIRENAFIYPIEAKRKVNILLDCDKMSEQSQNALLKILEEPPKFMVFILVCRNALGLLTTVRSRCITLSVKNPDFEDAFNFIKIKKGLPDNDIKEALENSHGNIGAALNALDGTTDKAVLLAKEFYSHLSRRDRLECAKVLYSFDKDRVLFAGFLKEFKFLISSELKKTVTENGEPKLTAKQLVNIAKTVNALDTTIKNHVGMPLHIPTQSTAMLAEIFAII